MKDRQRPWRGVTAVALGAALISTMTGCFVIQPPQNAPQTTPPVTTPPGPTNPPQEPPQPPTTTLPPTATSAASSQDWADIVEKTRSGVALVESVRCDGAGSGTGFLIDDDLVLTAAHVIEGSSQINLLLGDQLVPALVLGSNPAADIALLKTLRDMDGHHFELSAAEPRIGTNIAALGFPLLDHVAESKRATAGFKFTEGAISGLNQIVQIGVINTDGAMQTDTALNSGNSGGPLINAAGDIVGMAIAVQRGQSGDGPSVEGTAYAVPAHRLQEAAKQWQVAGNVQPLASCDAGEAPDKFILTPIIDSQHDQAVYVAQSFAAHGTAINLGNYSEAFSYFTPAMQQHAEGVDNWAAGLATSYWASFNVYDIEGSGDALEANVRLWTIQEPKYAPTGTEQWCSIWDNRYQMRWNESAWTIDGVAKNQEPQACDAQMLVDQLGLEQARLIVELIDPDYTG